MPNFEVFTRRARPAVSQPMVTVQRGGALGLNQAAVAALGDPEAVLLLFDREERMIGLRPVDRSEPNAYPVQRQPSGKGAVVTAKAFTQFYGISTEQARRYMAQFYGDVLGADLKQDTVGPEAGSLNGMPAGASAR
jgi:hypothetical protein